MAASSYARHVGVAFTTSWFWGEISDVFTVTYSTQSCDRCRWLQLGLPVFFVFVFFATIRSLLHCPCCPRQPAFLQSCWYAFPLVCVPTPLRIERRWRFSTSSSSSSKHVSGCLNKVFHLWYLMSAGRALFLQTKWDEMFDKWPTQKIDIGKFFCLYNQDISKK